MSSKGKRDSPALRRRAADLAQSSRSWTVYLMISASALVAVALTWTWWRKHELSQATSAVGIQRATPAAEQTSHDSSVRPSVVVTQPQVQVAQLKREAVDIAGQVAKAYPNDALAYALLGSAYYNTGKSDEATKHLRRCLELSPGQADAYEILARVAYEKGELDESIRLSQEALKRGPANPEVLNRLGRAFMDLGQTEEAIQSLQQAVRLPKPSSESFYLSGQAHMQSGNYTQAKLSFRQAISLLPDHTQALFGLYTACMRLGQTEEAERYREQFQKLEASDRRSLAERSAQEDTLTGLALVRETVARTFFGAAQIYRAHSEFEKAAELLYKSARLDAESPVYRAALESHYGQRKALAEGIRVFEQLVKEQPQSGLNYFFLGRLHTRLDQFDAAERAYQKVQELAPAWPEGYRALCELYLRADRKPDEARALARKVIELEPTGAGYYLLATVCVKGNDRAGALEAMKQAVTLSPGEPRYQQLLGQLQAAP
jgi:tetratricopeptide (TPR) repeat protein